MDTPPSSSQLGLIGWDLRKLQLMRFTTFNGNTCKMQLYCIHILDIPLLLCEILSWNATSGSWQEIIRVCSLGFSTLHNEGLMVPECLHQQDSSGRPSPADFTVRPANYFDSTWPFPYWGGWKKNLNCIFTPIRSPADRQCWRPHWDWCIDQTGCDHIIVWNDHLSEQTWEWVH